MKITYVVSKQACRLYIKLLFRLNIAGLENVPKTGAAIICSNHTSAYDPVVIGVALKRMPHYLAKAELFKNPLLGWFLRQVEAVPVDRAKTDMKAYKSILAQLKNGNLVGIFAQGTRVAKGEAKEAKAGVALFAVKSGAPVIPVAISSSYRIGKPIHILFGKPMDFSVSKGTKVKTEHLNEIAERIMQESNRLMEQVK